jgi:hypothetical protein
LFYIFLHIRDGKITYLQPPSNCPLTMEQAATQDDWRRTLRESEEMAATLEADGWDVVTVRAGHVAPEPPSHGDTDRFGFVYLAQGSDEDALRDAFDAGDFESYEVFSNRIDSDLYAITRLTDPDLDLVVLLVGAVNLTHATALATVAHDRGEMYSHVQLLDGTPLGSVHHDDPAHFLPEDL